MSLDNIIFTVGGELVGTIVEGKISLSSCSVSAPRPLKDVANALDVYSRSMDTSECQLWRAYVNAVLSKNNSLRKIVHQDVPNAPSYVLFFQIEKQNDEQYGESKELVQDIPLYIRQWMEQESNSIIDWYTRTQILP